MAEILLPERFVNALNDVRTALTTVSNEFTEVRLFGSCAKGNYSATSDLDILIITKKIIRSREQREYLRELVDDAIQKYYLEADVVFYTPDDYINDDSEFTANLRSSFLLMKGGE